MVVLKGQIETLLALVVNLPRDGESIKKTLIPTQKPDGHTRIYQPKNLVITEIPKRNVMWIRNLPEVEKTQHVDWKIVHVRQIEFAINRYPL